jgi:hypothetical protein
LNRIDNIAYSHLNFETAKQSSLRPNTGLVGSLKIATNLVTF